MWLKVPMKFLVGLLTKLREVCSKLPDRRTGKNTRYSMAAMTIMGKRVFLQVDNMVAFRYEMLQKTPWQAPHSW
jgi:hypothetical protein